MSLSLYEISIPVMIRGLNNLSALLDKGQAYATGKKFESTVLAQARLYPDMHPLSRQVQIACDIAKGAAARLADTDVPKHEDTESTFDELKQRIVKTGGFLQSIGQDTLKDAETKTIELKFPNGALKFTAIGYVTDFVLPNFYFHASMVYALLRTNGVEIGKSDFLGAIQ